MPQDGDDQSDIILADFPAPEESAQIRKRTPRGHGARVRQTAVVPEGTIDLALSQQREDTRRQLAFRLFWLIAILAVALCAAALSKAISISETKDLTTAILIPLLSIFASVVGFFFGERSRHS